MLIYKPIIFQNRNSPLISYIEFGVEKYLKNQKEIEQFHTKILGNSSSGPAGRIKTDWKNKNYLISFLWEMNNQINMDLWKMNYGWDSGPLSYNYVLDKRTTNLNQALKTQQDLGGASGNTLIVLGAEETKRRILEQQIQEQKRLEGEKLIEETTKQYILDKNRPQIPFNLVSNKEFKV